MRRTLALATVLSAATLATANSLTWDSSGANPASPVDGSGTWDTTTPLWSDGTQDVAWNNANNDTPVFGNGGPAGTVNIDPNGVTAAGLTFHAASGPFPYTLTGGDITLAIGNTTISTPNSGVVPVIFSSLAGSGATGGKGRFITFSGAITLSAAANSYVGRTTVTQSNVIIGSNGNQAYSAPFGAAGNMLTLDTSILTGNGSHTGASVSYQLPYNIKIIGNNTILTGKNFTLGELSSTLHTVQGSGSLTFNNNLSGTVSNISSNFSGAGIDAFTGTLHLSGYTIRLYPAANGNFLGVPNGILDNNAFASPQTPGAAFTFSLGALTGTGQLGGGDGINAGTATWSVGALGLSTTYSGTIAGNAALTLTGGSLTLNNFAPDTYIGPTTISGGTLVLARSNLTSTSSISVANTATLRLKPGISINTATLSLAAGGTFDITGNSETFDTTVAGHDAASLVAALASAYANGAWTGTGITSSTAAADPQHATAIGYRITGSQFLLQLASYGDANLDGKVDADDYALLDRSYAQSLPNAHWQDGDFNYDGVITSADYVLIDTAYGQTHGLSPEFLSTRESQFGDAYVSQLLASVPEPSSLACLYAGLLVATRRRFARRGGDSGQC